MRKKNQKQTKHNPESEAAQREAIRLWDEGPMHVRRRYAEPHLVEYFGPGTGDILAIFDLRDCYRKRQNLTGIIKAVRKAVQPRRKK